MDTLEEFAAAMERIAKELRKSAWSFRELIHVTKHDAQWYPDDCQFCRDEIAEQDMRNEQIRE
jgi:hypothetical protein